MIHIFHSLGNTASLQELTNFLQSGPQLFVRGNIPISVVCKMLVEYDPNQNQVLKLTLSEREEFLAGRKRQSLRSRRWKGSPWWWIFHLSEVVWPKCVCQGFVFWDFHPQSLIPRSCLFLPEWCTQGIFHPLPHPASHLVHPFLHQVAIDGDSSSYSWLQQSVSGKEEEGEEEAEGEGEGRGR